MTTTHNSKRITVGGKALDVFANNFRLAEINNGTYYTLDRVSPSNRPIVADAMAEVAALDAADPSVQSAEAEQRAVDAAYDSEARIERALVRGY